MRYIVDFHIHSKYSRATSPLMDVANLALAAERKGIDVLATGDITHPQYLKELKTKLVEDGSGLLELKKGNKTKFILSGEISCIYKDKGKTRRVHLLLLVPDFATIEKINSKLTERGCNLRSDGRPMIGLSAKELAGICFEANSRSVIIPAHAWTPWYAIFGSKSGYDSLEECFEELTPKIFAFETGISSDPEMNWRLSALDSLALISNSDAHSLGNLGREANAFDFADGVSFDLLMEALRTRNKKNFLFTIEFFPQEGKYYDDGHLDCAFACSSTQSKELKSICPKCKKELTLGVNHRIAELADRELGHVPPGSIPFKYIIPLQEIIAECLQKSKTTKGVQAMYEKMLSQGNNEFEILLDLSREEISSLGNSLIAEAIMRMREKKVIATPGYDGKSGIVTVFAPGEIESLS